MEKSKTKVLILNGVIVALLIVGGITYAFFQASVGDAAIKAAQVTTGTTDSLTFNIANELNLTNINQTTMAENAISNQDTSTLATVELKANNASAATPQQYYMYLVTNDNPFVYTKDNNTPELLLKLEYNTGGDNYIEITDSNKSSYQGVSLEGLTYKTVNSGTNR